MLDRGVYRAGNNYEKGDAVTWDGNIWIAQTETKDKPGETNSWRLAVRKGRDGKAGEPGPVGPQGIPGLKGRDGGTY
jgi:collagen type III alpha